MTLDELRTEQRAALPLDEALATAGIGRTAGRAAAASGRLPFRVIRMGQKRLLVPTVELQKVLGVESDRRPA